MQYKLNQLKQTTQCPKIKNSKSLNMCLVKMCDKYDSQLDPTSITSQLSCSDCKFYIGDEDSMRQSKEMKIKSQQPIYSQKVPTQKIQYQEQPKNAMNQLKELLDLFD